MSKIYDKDTAVHGDVYADKDDYWKYIVITKTGKAFAEDSADLLLEGANGNGDRFDYLAKGRLGKFLYNVLDKESADSDCEIDVVAELDSLLQELKEDNTKEAIMPLKIIKTTTTELPNGTPVDIHTVNGVNFETISDATAVNLIRDANAEIKALRLDAKDSGSKRIKEDADALAAVRKVFVGLLDDRTES